MITTVAFLLLMLTVPLFGGDLVKLGEIRLRHWWTIVSSLVLQVLVISVIPDKLSPEIGAAFHLLSYALAIGFTWFNRWIKGIPILVLGGLLNVLVIGANGGVMPARLGALETAGVISDSVTFENSAPVEDARLWWLGDVFAIPEGIPFANVFSIGDLLLVIGGAVSVHMICESRLARRWSSEKDESGDVSVATALGVDASSEHERSYDLPPASLAMPAAVPTSALTEDEQLDAPPIATPAGSLASALGSRQAASTGLADLFQADNLPTRSAESTSR